MKLVIVESPTKAHTIQKFLGKDFKILSSFGHVRDLPKTKLGVDIENNFEPKYVVIPKARRVISLLKEEAQKSEKVILATDEDREGESIAFHLKEVLKLDDKKPYERIVFHEITKPAIEEALKNPRKIDMNLVSAQQARRILDRIVGYKLSPLLWKKVARGLSAGRVQSVALRLIVEREKERENFVPQEYWEIKALFQKENKDFEAKLTEIDEKKIEKLEIGTKKEAERIVKDINGHEFEVLEIEEKKANRNPLPPFVTSTLQQEAWKRFYFSAKKTMKIAQDLYERGFITYHRTDSLNLSSSALNTAKKFIIDNFGEDYYQFRKFKTRAKTAQEAHEAIRPTFTENTPEKLKIKEKLDDAHFKLYDLIWRRFLATQMKPAIFAQKSILLGVKKYKFLATGQTLIFEGFLKVYPLSFNETGLPLLKKGEKIKPKEVVFSQRFTQPPPRYNEATLIKELEKNGIGRPSTYATIISTIQQRNYVKKDAQRRFYPTDLGKVVSNLLTKHFPKIVDLKFTAKMEEDLDLIAKGEKDRVGVLKEFYIPFKENLEKKEKEISKKEITEEKTDKKCPLCGAPLIIKIGRYGKFYSCSRFPECKYRASYKEEKKN